MPKLEERLTTAREAGREARSVLGPLVSALEWSLGSSAAAPSQQRMASGLARVVGHLYAAEVEAAQGAHGALDRALVGIEALLETARADSGQSDLAATLARSLARLHPPTIALGRALSDPDDEAEVVPLLLSRRRQPKPSGDDATTTQRRAEQRESLEVDIGFASDTNFYSGFSGDLSDGGLFVATYSVLPVGTELLLSFVLPGGRQISAKGRVQWTSEPHDDAELTPGMGVRFEELSTDDAEAVRAFLAQREPIFHP